MFRVAAALAVAGAVWFAPAVAGAAPECPSGAYTTVYDDAGNAHDACVDVAASSFAALPERAPAQSSSRTADDSLPSTGANATLLVLAGALVAAGSAAQLAARRRS